MGGVIARAPRDRSTVRGAERAAAKPMPGNPAWRPRFQLTTGLRSGSIAGRSHIEAVR